MAEGARNERTGKAREESMPRFHAPRLFMGAATLGPQGLMQADVVLVAAERRNAAPE